MKNLEELIEIHPPAETGYACLQQDLAASPTACQSDCLT